MPKPPAEVFHGGMLSQNQAGIWPTKSARIDVRDVRIDTSAITEQFLKADILSLRLSFWVPYIFRLRRHPLDLSDVFLDKPSSVRRAGKVPERGAEERRENIQCCLNS